MFKYLFDTAPATDRSPGRNIGDTEAVRTHLEGQLTELEDIVGHPGVENTEELGATVARVREIVESSDGPLPEENLVDQLDERLQSYYLKGAQGVDVKGILEVLGAVESESQDYRSAG